MLILFDLAYSNSLPYLRQDRRGKPGKRLLHGVLYPDPHQTFSTMTSYAY